LKTNAFVFLGAAMAAWTVGCSTMQMPAPPSATNAALLRTASKQGATREQIATGHDLFVSRCIECHVLPDVSKQDPADWSRIVRVLAKRAHLGPEQHDAVLAYLSAATTAQHR
jgi:mono/diheme cytochrome c family protein